MTDVVNPETRSRMMSGIRGKNTKPEIIIRSQLHRLGFRFRIHNTKLPGKPDIVLKKYRAVIFIHGCFWHRHLCHLFKWPKTHPDFWKKKINNNHARDKKILDQLIELNWRICVVWECAIKGSKKNIPSTVGAITEWLSNGDKFLEISG